jgi:hypothetical protein
MPLKLSLEDRFNNCVEDWIKYCSQPEVLYSSSGHKELQAEAYLEIVDMGRDALALIRKLYDREGDIGLGIIKLYGLHNAVINITKGEFKIPREMAGKLNMIADYTKKWLDENI